MLHNLNAELVNALRKKLPESTTLANVLVNILGIGREAAYRRIRGIVPFSVEEMGIISQKLNISLDKLLKVESAKDRKSIPLNIFRYVSPVDLYEEQIGEYAKLFNQFSEELRSVLKVASNVLVQPFYFKYEHLARFSFYRWMYRQGESSLGKSFEAMEIPERIWEKQRRYAVAAQSFHECSHIWGKEMFSLFINDVTYVYKLRLMSKESLEEIKNELLQVLEDMERIVVKGCFENGNKVDIRLAGTDFDATYALIKTSEHRISLAKIFSVDTVFSYSAKAFNNLKEWMDEAQSQAILLSEDTEKRKEFFQTQREVVKSLM